MNYHVRFRFLTQDSRSGRCIQICFFVSWLDLLILENVCLSGVARTHGDSCWGVPSLSGGLYTAVY